MSVIECSCGFACITEAGFERHLRLQGPQNASRHQRIFCPKVTQSGNLTQSKSTQPANLRQQVVGAGTPRASHQSGVFNYGRSQTLSSSKGQIPSLQGRATTPTSPRAAQDMLKVQQAIQTRNASSSFVQPSSAMQALAELGQGSSPQTSNSIQAYGSPTTSAVTMFPMARSLQSPRTQVTTATPQSQTSREGSAPSMGSPRNLSTSREVSARSMGSPRNLSSAGPTSLAAHLDSIRAPSPSFTSAEHILSLSVSEMPGSEISKPVTLSSPESTEVNLLRAELVALQEVTTRAEHAAACARVEAKQAEVAASKGALEAETQIKELNEKALGGSNDHKQTEMRLKQMQLGETHMLKASEKERHQLTAALSESEDAAKKDIAQLKEAFSKSEKVAKMETLASKGNRAYYEKMQQEVAELRAINQQCQPSTRQEAEIAALKSSLVETENYADAAKRAANELAARVDDEQALLLQARSQMILLTRNEQVAMEVAQQSNRSSEELDVLRNQLKQSAQLSAASVRELDALRSELATVEANAEKEKSAFSARHQEVIGQLQDVQAIASKSQVDVAALTEAYEPLSVENERLRDEVDELKKQIASKSQKEVVALREASEPLRVENERLRDEVDKLKKQIAYDASKSQVEVVALREASEPLRIENEKLKKQLEISKQQVKSLEGVGLQAENAEKEAQEQKRVAAWIESQHAVVVHRATAAEAEVQKLKEQVKELSDAEAEVQELKQQVKELSNGHPIAQKSVEAAVEAESSAAEVAHRTQIELQSQSDSKNLEKRFRDLELEAEEHQRLAHSLQAELEDAQEQIQSLSFEVEGLKNEDSKAKMDCADAEQARRKLQESSTYLEIEVGRLRAEISEKNKQHASNEERIKEAENKVKEALAHELRSMKEALETAQAETESVTKERMAWQTQNDEAYASVKEKLEKQIENSMAHANQVLDFESLRKELKIAKDGLQEFDHIARKAAEAEANLQDLQIQYAYVKAELQSLKSHQLEMLSRPSLVRGKTAPSLTTPSTPRGNIAAAEPQEHSNQAPSDEASGCDGLIHVGAQIWPNFPPQGYFDDYLLQGRPPPTPR